MNLAAIECPAGMVYQQCGQACPQTCDTVDSEECVGGCVEGCFCPSGKVLWKGNCLNASECAGIWVQLSHQLCTFHCSGNFQYQNYFGRGSMS